MRIVQKINHMVVIWDVLIVLNQILISIFQANYVSIVQKILATGRQLEHVNKL